MGILCKAGVPCVVGEGGVPFLAEVAHFVEGGGAGGTSAGR